MDFTQRRYRYLYFFISFSNFIPAIQKLLFIIIFALTYIPLAILIGYIHRKPQFRLENKINTEEQLYRDMITKELQTELNLSILRIQRKITQQNNSILKVLNIDDSLMFKEEVMIWKD